MVAASRRGDEIVASLEDAGYGCDIQRANFPRVEVVEKIKHWPVIDLSETVVIAHPPCAAFSTQNRSRDPLIRGAGAKKFCQTVAVLEYAGRNKALAVAVESVPGTLVGGKSAHDDFARDFGYNLYRIMLNSATCGVAQFRKRFWAIFIRKGAAKDTQPFSITPKLKTVGDVVCNSVGRELVDIEYVAQASIKQVRKLIEGMGEEKARAFLKKPGNVVRHAADYIGLKGKDAKEWTERYAIGYNFTSHSMVKLDPEAQAPVLLAGSWWWYWDRPLALQEYLEVMDFPREYVFPTREQRPLNYYPERSREYLSRGVCPATAEWILSQVERAVTDGPVTGSKVMELEPGGTADFSPLAKRSPALWLY